MRKILLTYVLNLFAIIATASVQYNGLNYELNSSKNTATVLKSESAENLIIPETIMKVKSTLLLILIIMLSKDVAN